jgi:hypothetical protein
MTSRIQWGGLDQTALRACRRSYCGSKTRRNKVDCAVGFRSRPASGATSLIVWLSTPCHSPSARGLRYLY